MITRLFLIVFSIALSGQGLGECVEENTLEKTQALEVVYEDLTSSQTKKKIQKLACKYAPAFLPARRKLLHFVAERIHSQTPFYLQNRSIRT